MKTIKFKLNPTSVRNAIKEVKKYQDSLPAKCERLCQALAEVGVETANMHISQSPLGKTITVVSTVTQEAAGCQAIVMAIGQTIENEGYAPFNTLLAVEFGAGIHYIKGSENPRAADFGLGVGTFPGQTHAMQEVWFYKDDDGWHASHGVKATMPMYLAGQAVREKIFETAKAVFES